MFRVRFADLKRMATVGLPLVESAGRGPADPEFWVVDLDEDDQHSVAPLVEVLRQETPTLIGVSRHEVPSELAELVECFAFTLAPSGPGRSWVAVPDLDRELQRIETVVARAPRAARVLTALLRSTATLPVADALAMESMAYSLLLTGEEHAVWLSQHKRHASDVPEHPVLVTRVGDELRIELNRPERRNAFGRVMRDGVLEALRIAAVDPTVRVVLSGRGPSFCSGGDLGEFGTGPQAVMAHEVRMATSAGHLVHRLADRCTVQVQGAAVGAGVEIAAFAGRVEAAESAYFGLPELNLALIPGAGGTVSLPRRIGRWRTAWMAFSGTCVDVDTAESWGLVDARL